MLATTLVDSGSTVDELLVEELIGTESLVLRLDGDLADERVFPAVDLGRVRHPARGRAGRGPGARRPREAAARADRRATEQGLAGLLDRLRKTQTNYELLSAAQRSS